MTTTTLSLKTFPDQKPGTSGLRKKTKVFQQPGYLEAYLQAVFEALGGVGGKTFVVGGDGRFFNDQALASILRIAAAAGAARAIVGQAGLLSTPAASHLIRKRRADFGLILSASHNPGGPDGDFGLKVNMANGGPASEALNAAIFRASGAVHACPWLDQPLPDLTQIGTTRFGPMLVEVVDPVADYAALMESLFDFDLIRERFFGQGRSLRFDAMHAVTGPYAREIFERRLGAAPGSVIHATPLPDFGGDHPDPNPVWAHDLYATAFSPGAPDLAAASDGDGDRNMILGRNVYVSPSDSLAVLAEHLPLCPGYKKGLAGVARSMPTSRAVDRVAHALGLACYATPTGWKFFGTLLDAGLVELCGEESFGTGSNHIREKDGLWAALAWLNILAATGLTVAELLEQHWRRFGRTWYSRHDYENLPEDLAQTLLAELRGKLSQLAGRPAGRLVVEKAEDFAYTDPVDQTQVTGQGIQIFFSGGGRAVLRLSGTGTEGATLRLYLERLREGFETGDVQAALAPVVEAIEALTGLRAKTKRMAPDVIT